MGASLVPLYSNADGGNDHGTVLEQTHRATGDERGDLQGGEAQDRWGNEDELEPWCSIYGWKGPISACRASCH